MKYSTDLFDQALLFAARAHGKQKMKGSKIPYIVHPVMVAMEVMEFLEEMPEEDPNLLIQAALLHDVYEDTKTSRADLNKLFGETVDQVVYLLSKEIRAEKKKITWEEYIDQLAEAPKSVQIVKMADRIVNLNPPPKNWSKKRIIKYYEESRMIYDKIKKANAPLANRLNKKMSNYGKIYAAQ